MTLDATFVAGSSTTEVANQNQSQLEQIQLDGDDERKRTLSCKSETAFPIIKLM